MSPAALAVLHAQAFERPPPWTENDFASFLKDPACFLCTRGADAFGLFRVAADEAELLTLATSPRMRRQGFARAVLARGLITARDRGARACFLEVAADNHAACALYTGLGFAPHGRRKGYYRKPGQPPVDALVFKARLDALEITFSEAQRAVTISC